MAKLGACAVLAVPLSFAVAVLAQTPEAQSTGRLMFVGSGGALAGVRALANAYVAARPDVAVEVAKSIGSTGGIEAVAAGVATVGLTARPLRDSEKARGVSAFAYARAALVFVTHAGVPDDGITGDDLVRIYRGEKTRWSDGREILVFMRNAGDSTVEDLGRVPGFAAAHADSVRARRWKTFYTVPDMAEAVARTPDAFGVSDTGTVAASRLPLKVLRFNGVAPTEATVASGAYPLVTTLAFVVRADGLTPHAKAFIDFARSAEGARILRATGYFPHP